jgi:hypothetical protein
VSCCTSFRTRDLGDLGDLGEDDDDDDDDDGADEGQLHVLVISFHHQS